MTSENVLRKLYLVLPVQKHILRYLTSHYKNRQLYNLVLNLQTQFYLAVWKTECVQAYLFKTRCVLYVLKYNIVRECIFKPVVKHSGNQ